MKCSLPSECSLLKYLLLGFQYTKGQFKVNLTLCFLMCFPIHIDTIVWNYPLCTLRGLHLSMKIVLIRTNNADPDEMQHYAEFHPCLHCLPRYPSEMCVQKRENLGSAGQG